MTYKFNPVYYFLIPVLNVSTLFSRDNKDTLTKLLLFPSHANKTALNYAAIQGNSGIVKKLLLTAENIRDFNTVLTKLLLSTDIFGGTTLCDAIETGSSDIVSMLLLTTEYIRKGVCSKLILDSSKSNTNVALVQMLERGNINTFVPCLQDTKNAKYVEKHTLKALLPIEETIKGASCPEQHTNQSYKKKTVRIKVLILIPVVGLSGWITYYSGRLFLREHMLLQ